MNKRLNIRRFAVPLFILLLGASLVIMLYKTKPEAIKKTISEKIWYVHEQTIQLKNHRPFIQLTGKIIPVENIEISSAIETDVIKRWVNVGDKVKKSQLILSFDPYKFKLVVAQRQAEVDEITANIEEQQFDFETNKRLLQKENALSLIANNAVDRAITLEKNEMAPSSQLDDARRLSLNQEIGIIQRKALINNYPNRLRQLEAKLDFAKNRLKIAKQDLSRTKISAPINGTIAEIIVGPSEHVNKGKRLFRIISHNQLELKVLLPEKYLTKIKAAMDETRGWVLLNQDRVPMVLQRISGEIQDQLAGSFLYFSLSINSVRFVSGQTLAVQLDLPVVKNSVAIPSDALYGTEKIFKIQHQRLQQVAVIWLGKTITENRQTRFLISGLDLHFGDKILTTKFANAMDGLKVMIIDSNDSIN